jgi:hypothetical protein
VEVINDSIIIPELKDTIPASFYEKLGMQPILQTSKELLPFLGKHHSVTKDYE